MRNLFILAFAALAFKAESQVKIAVNFNASKIDYNSYYLTAKNDSLQFNNIRFYLSDFRFFESKTNKWKSLLKQKYFLIDLEDSNSLILDTNNLHLELYDSLKFNIGVDSLANVSGANSGALDPTLGMYWAWQSGYINFKIEGTCVGLKTRNNAFGFHVGGYLFPNYSLRTCSLALHNQPKLTLELDLNVLFDFIELAKLNSVMIPGKQAMELSNKFATCFEVKP